MLYRNKFDPSINSSEWTKSEEKKLLALINSKFGCYNWAAIAEELGTNRTPLACLMHYQRSLNSNLINSSPWSEEEIQLLVSAVELYGESHWQHVANSVPGRMPLTCRSVWLNLKEKFYSNKNGNWQPFEDKLLFLAAVAFKFPNINDTKKSKEDIEALKSHLISSRSSSDLLTNDSDESVVDVEDNNLNESIDSVKDWSEDNEGYNIFLLPLLSVNQRYTQFETWKSRSKLSPIPSAPPL